MLEMSFLNTLKRIPAGAQKMLCTKLQCKALPQCE